MGPYKPIPGNRAGSYLTAFSLQGFYSNINGIIIGLVQIFADQSYWQSAVAASPIHAVKVTSLPSSHTCTVTLALSQQEPSVIVSKECYRQEMYIDIKQMHVMQALQCQAQ